MPSSITSDEVNFLVYRYLQESGFLHSSFSLAHESHLFSRLKGDVQVATGALVTLLQKALLYTEVETHFNENGSEKRCHQPFSLLQPHVCQEDNTMQIDDVVENGENNDKPLTLSGHSAEVFLCSWHPSKNIIATGSGDSTSRIWSIDNKYEELSVLKQNEGKEANDMTSLDWSHDGTRLATGSYDGTIKVWSDEGVELHSLRKHNGPVFSLRWNKDSTLLLSGCADKTSIVWDSHSGQIIQTFSNHSGATLDVDWKDTSTFASCSADKSIHVYSIDSTNPKQIFNGHLSEVNTVRWNNDGSLLASCSDDKTAKIWRPENSSCIETFSEHNREIYTLRWSPKDDNIVSTASFDATVKVWDVSTKRCLYTLNSHREPIYSIAYSPDGKYLASGSFDKHLNIWSTKDGKLIKSFLCDGGIFEVSWNAKCNRVAASTSRHTVNIFELGQ
ncbi:hypothetical protein O9G_000706 [Rozella allomycis CSF55]|uniref:WD40 repeat-like protein n=1 Tax=Rozella allomycis (strain CSF55) TaxID=988480 RepID=A0A075AYA6_ROZAC|nr:hypothetical protein O9G_000706 [Rozella allomycis CSF55]|eukprot:EPZ35310.1 hypothetical protein O9G_000706 [Rozella allomycis CSF55]